MKFTNFICFNYKISNFSLISISVNISTIKNGIVTMFRKFNLILCFTFGLFCISCTTESIDICDYKNDPISYDCIQGIFDMNCVECHNISGAQKPYLDAGISYQNIVDKDVEWNEYKYIYPEYPYLSHIFLAISNSNLDENWFMPKNRPKLSQDKIDYMEAWINAGAPLN